MVSRYECSRALTDHLSVSSPFPASSYDRSCIKPTSCPLVHVRTRSRHGLRSCPRYPVTPASPHVMLSRRCANMYTLSRVNATSFSCHTCALLSILFNTQPWVTPRRNELLLTAAEVPRGLSWRSCLAIFLGVLSCPRDHAIGLCKARIQVHGIRIFNRVP